MNARSNEQVGFKKHTLDIGDHSFKDVDSSGGSCYNLCETTIRGTLRTKAAIEANDAGAKGGEGGEKEGGGVAMKAEKAEKAENPEKAEKAEKAEKSEGAAKSAKEEDTD